MIPLINRLAPSHLEFKGAIVSAFFENPFFDPDVKALYVRFGGERAILTEAVTDLCRCGVLAEQAGRYRFAPDSDLYPDVATWALSQRGDVAMVRQQVVEAEALARLGEKLSVSQQEVSAILDIVPAGVLVLDRFGHVLKSNAIAQKLLQVSDNDFDTDVCALLGLDLKEVLAKPCYVEQDGPPPFGVTTQPFKVSGSDTGVVMALQDLTARRALEAEADRLRDAFFSMIRHELRKPLMTVERFLGQLENGKTDGLMLAQEATTHLGAMIDDMLFLARLERDPMTVVASENVSLQFLLASGDLAFRAKAQEVGVALHVQMPEPDVIFCGDTRRLTQVLGNLIDNALKFTPNGGLVRLAGGIAGDQVWFSVQDSGPGIPEMERHHVFEKFYQASSGGRYPGLGLGLAICRHIVSAHEGAIEISDATAGGALVRVCLPQVHTGEVKA